MPLYGFVCKSCGHLFQTLVRSSDVPACPTCDSADLEQQLSLIAAPQKGGSDPVPMCEGPAMGGCGQCGMLGGAHACG